MSSAAVSGVGSGQLSNAGGAQATQRSGGDLQQQVAVEAAANSIEQQQQQGQNAVELIQSSGIGQNVNVQA